MTSLFQRGYFSLEPRVSGRKLPAVTSGFSGDPKQPFTEQELAGISYALHGRPEHDVLTDSAKKVPATRDVRKWASKPNRLELGGIDRPGAKDKHLEARIDILAGINECSRKRSCGTVGSIKNSLETAGKYDSREIEEAIAAARDAGYFE